MKEDKFLNWGEISRYLTGARDNVRRNRIPKKHLGFINKLREAIITIINKQENDK